MEIITNNKTQNTQHVRFLDTVKRTREHMLYKEYGCFSYPISSYTFTENFYKKRFNRLKNEDMNKSHYSHYDEKTKVRRMDDGNGNIKNTYIKNNNINVGI